MERGCVGDMIFDEKMGIQQGTDMIDHLDTGKRSDIPEKACWTDLLVPVFRGGKLVYMVPGIEEARNRTLDQISRLHSGIKLFDNPQQYPVGLENRLHELKNRLITQNRNL